MINHFTLRFTQPVVEIEFLASRHKQELKEFNCFLLMCFINMTTKFTYGIMTKSYSFSGVVSCAFILLLFIRLGLERRKIQIQYVFMVIQLGILVAYNFYLVLPDPILQGPSMNWLLGFEICVMFTYVYLQGTNFIMQTATLLIVLGASVVSLQIEEPQDICVEVGFVLLTFGMISMRYQFELSKRQQYLEVISNQKWLIVLELVQNQWTTLIKFDQQQQLKIQKSTKQEMKHFRFEDDVQFRLLLRDMRVFNEDSPTSPVKNQHIRQQLSLHNTLEHIIRQRLLRNQTIAENRDLDTYKVYHLETKLVYEVMLMDYYYNYEKTVLLIIKHDNQKRTIQKLQKQVNLYTQMLQTQVVETTTNSTKLLKIMNEQKRIKQVMQQTSATVGLIHNSIYALANANNLHCYLSPMFGKFESLQKLTTQILLQMLSPLTVNNIKIHNALNIQTNLKHVSIIIFNMIWIIQTILRVNPCDFRVSVKQIESEVFTCVQIKFKLKDVRRLLHLKLIDYLLKPIPYNNNQMGNLNQKDTQKQTRYLLYKSLVKLFKLMRALTQSMEMGIRTALQLVVIKYLLTSYGTTNSIQYYNTNSNHSFQIQLIHMPDILRSPNSSISKVQGMNSTFSIRKSRMMLLQHGHRGS